MANDRDAARDGPLAQTRKRLRQRLFAISRSRPPSRARGACHRASASAALRPRS